MSDSLIRILVVDDHPLVRKSIMAMLTREPDMEVIGTAKNGREAIQLAEETAPDVIVMDVSMPVLDGIRAAEEIQTLASPPKIIMLSMHYNSVLVQQARNKGAVGYINKQQANQELVPAVRAAYADQLSL